MTSKDILKVTLNLVIIYIAGGLLLAGVYAWTSPIIFIKNKEEKEAALKKMVPEADGAPQKVGDWEIWHRHAEYFEAYKDGEPFAYIVETYGKGYSSYIHILTALDKDFVVKKMDVIAHAETPGLGDEIELDWFKDMFKGKDLDHLVVIKGETEDKIQAITGATISSRAVTNGVRDAIVMLKEKYSGQGPEEEKTGEEGHGARAEQLGAH